MLSDEELDEIGSSISVYALSSDGYGELDDYAFSSGEADEYRAFLFEEARKLEELHVCKTYLMIHNKTNELVGYFTLSADSIKLAPEEKSEDNLDEVVFRSIPAIKLGKLAINQKLSSDSKRKGYGSFAIEQACFIANDINNNYAACRFLTVDADIQYCKTTTKFYENNNFVYNQANKNKNATTVSMRRDILE